MKKSLFISCPKGVESLLADEVLAFGMQVTGQTPGGVHAESSMDEACDFCLYSRLANRIILVLGSLRVSETKDIYEAVKSIQWDGLFTLGNTFAVDFRGTNNFIKHSNYGGLLVKDAVVDWFNERQGARPNVDTTSAQVTIYAHVRKENFMFGIDLSGGSLHKRGYRSASSKAPLKENLAAALMLRAGVKTGDDRYLVDPMCGSGTLLIEGLLIKLGIAPNILVEHFGFEKLQGIDLSRWQSLKEKAIQHRQEAITEAEKKGDVLAWGYDKDGRAIASAQQNAQAAGLGKLVTFRQMALKDFKGIDAEPVLLVSNPPYGERLQDRDSLFPVYQLLGEKIRQCCQGGQAAILSSDDYLLKALALQKTKAYQFYNGAIKTQWLLFEIYKKDKVQQEHHDERFQQGVDMVANRLRKNRKRLEKWANKEGIEAYRLYDADMPEYAFALDRYLDRFQLAEYLPPKSVDQFGAFQRRKQFEQAVRQVFEITDSRLFFKERSQQKGKSQYEKLANEGNFFVVKEGLAQFRVNLSDYLDTGLFLDHRPVRQMLFKQAPGKRFLNLFSYTSTATVHAALGGAVMSTSVDMSKTYINWSERNFALNSLDKEKHTLVRANCLEWLDNCKDEYDLVFLDPPSFSNSTRMDDSFDVQRDHRELIKKVMGLLAENGELWFSTNLRGFRIDNALNEYYLIEDISKKTLDRDFERNKHIHQCFVIRHK